MEHWSRSCFCSLSTFYWQKTRNLEGLILFNLTLTFSLNLSLERSFLFTQTSPMKHSEFYRWDIFRIHDQTINLCWPTDTLYLPQKLKLEVRYQREFPHQLQLQGIDMPVRNQMFTQVWSREKQENETIDVLYFIGPLDNSCR